MGKRISQEEFIRRAKEIHGDKYDYSKVEYISTTKKVCIICPLHGEFWQTHHNHFKQNCPKCSKISRGKKRRKNTEWFINSAIKVHGELYDYSKSIYTKSDVKVCVICKKHGQWWVIPSSHLRGCGCPGCSIDKVKNNTIPFDSSYIERKLLKIHNNKYKYLNIKDQYKKHNSIIEIICPTHGLFSQQMCVHKRGHGCPKCGFDKIKEQKKKTHLEFLKQAEERHGDEYEYIGKYKTCLKPIKIKCKTHGIFEQAPTIHISGGRCPLCIKEEFIKNNRNKPKGWTYSIWDEKAKQSKNFDSFKVYILKCWNENEMFFKIGRTFRKINKRFESKNDIPYNYEIMETIVFDDAKECCEYEQELKNVNIEHKYTPKKHFKGMYECFIKMNINENTYDISNVN